MPTWFAVIPPGLEPVLAAELAQLHPPGLGRVAQVPGGVRFEAPLATGARLCASLRSPSRVLLELVSGPAASYDALAEQVRRVDWRPFLHPWSPLEVASTSRASRLHFRDANQKRVAHAIADALRGPRLPSLRDRRPPLTQRVQVRIEEDQATISIDASGELLHIRGWRKVSGKAPLRENLAAALLLKAGWRGDEPLVDPFCGSGSFCIEAALLAAGRPPWTDRRFAWQDWPALARERAPDHRRPRHPAPPSVTIVGSDRSGEALAGALENATRAGVNLSWIQRDVSALEPPPGVGLVIANPPYGERLGQQVDGVYRAFGRSLRERFAGWRVLFLSPSAALAGQVHRDARSIGTFSNGGLRVGIWALSLR